MDDRISVGLAGDIALVLFDWLARTSVSGQPAAFADQAEQRALWNLEAALESLLIEPLSADYDGLVARARDRIRDNDAQFHGITGAPAEIAGFSLILASSVGERDGMGLELIRADGERVAEVFDDDDTGARTFTVFSEQQVPILAIEWLLSVAKTRL